jgi:signal transduction histidine kinase
LERQLHDGASLRVSALALRLGLLRERTPGDAPDWRERIDELQDELHAVLQELRDVSSKIYPPLLDQAGLSAALRELTDQAGLEVILEVPPGARFGPAAEGAAYFAVASCLAARPTDATGVARISVTRQTGRGLGDQDDLVLRVDGVTARDLRSILDQARPLGGTAELVEDGPVGTGTITVRIPCE